MTKIALLAISALCMVGCAHSQPPPLAAPPPAHQADAPPPPPPEAAAPDGTVTAHFSMTPRPGWVGLPSNMVPDGMAAVVLNPPAHAALMIMVDSPATMTARQAADALRTQMAGPPNAWTCSAVTAWPDANSASFTVSQGTQRGRITVRRMHEGPAINVLFMGRWPAAANPASLADYNAMVSGAAMQ